MNPSDHAASTPLAQALELQDESRTLRGEAAALLAQQGQPYGPSSWLTPERYAARYGLSPAVVEGWLEEGLVPSSDTMTLPELGGMRLLRDRLYPAP